MLMQYKKDFEKTTMGLLSLLDDFKTIENLKEEISLNEKDNDFKLFLYKDKVDNIVGVVGTQIEENFVIIRYISLAPGYRDKTSKKQLLEDLMENDPKKMITAVPEYIDILKLKRKNDR